jgi:hypothetical protein
MKSKPKGVRYHKLILIPLGLCLACGGAGKIVPIMSKNMFMVEGASSDAEAIKDANAFCGRQGKTAIIPPHGPIIFKCASPGDPGYESPNQPTEGK